MAPNLARNGKRLGWLAAQANVITLTQPGRRNMKNKDQEDWNVSAPEVQRAIGALEATASYLKQAVDSLTKSQGENNVLTAQIVQKLDSIGKDLHATGGIAQTALDKAAAAHSRLDQLKWTALGFGSGAGALVGFFADKLAALFHAARAMVAG